MDKDKLEKFSSAITLSDMEIFVFPELMYSLVLANIMSPIIWKWREERTFKKLKGKSKYRKLMRMKQYIMDEYEFNLDLETWGMTDKDIELKRFKEFISPEDISKSNALFGYHGDKYYFDVDIRRHFGLDKYNDNIIPYWKTETVEAMEAFKYKDGYETGAGECVSLAALYAAAAFVVCEIPLEDIFMILTPLHSQNFIDLKEGIITNNRRLVTKSMWFNGSAISNKAQRALRNEQVTIVSHCSGYNHCLYDKATIDKQQYSRLGGRLQEYLYCKLDLGSFANFLRTYRDYQKYFQVCRECHGRAQFIKAETLFHYEHGSDYRIADDTHKKLLDEVAQDDYYCYELPGRIRCDQLEKLFRKKKIDIRNEESRKLLAEYLGQVIPESEQFVDLLWDFLHIEPQLPSAEKKFSDDSRVEIKPEWNREQIIEYLQSVRGENVTAELAFYAYRDMKNCQMLPFVKAALERNPVSVETFKDESVDTIYQRLKEMDNASIYDASRLAQPDEVVNYGRGDGLEKAFTMADILYQRQPDRKVTIAFKDGKATVTSDKEFYFESEKPLDDFEINSDSLK
jgi:hypothetical protein